MAETLSETFDAIRGDIHLYELGEIDYRTMMSGLSHSVALLKARLVTHGRHCRCSACAREDWTGAELAPCGMHGPSCPGVYAPLDEPLAEPARRG